MITKIRTEKQYGAVMKTIENLLDDATKKGSLHKLSEEEAAILASLSKAAEEFEDKVLAMMPISGQS